MISIRHARLDEKEKTYRWLCLSDTVPFHMGPPDFPENPVPDLEQFQAGFEDFYYQEDGRHKGSVMIIAHGGDEIGCLCYACFHLQPGNGELDIWMRSQAYCGKGYGPKALQLLMDYMEAELQVKRWIIRPSERNLRAIAAYERVGFRPVIDKKDTLEAYLRADCLAEYGPGDYGFDGTAVLTREITQPGDAKAVDHRGRLGANPFSYILTKDGKVHILWQGRTVKILRDRLAKATASKLQKADDNGIQMILAKATGNFKRGNERR